MQLSSILGNPVYLLFSYSVLFIIIIVYLSSLFITQWSDNACMWQKVQNATENQQHNISALL